MHEVSKNTSEASSEADTLKVEPSLLPSGIKRTALEISQALVKASSYPRPGGYLDVLENARQLICRYNSSWKDNPFMSPLLETLYGEEEIPRLTDMALAASRENGFSLTAYSVMLATFRLLKLREIDSPIVSEYVPGIDQKVLNLFAKGLDSSGLTVGYHGTTLEALIYMLKNGVLIGTTHDENIEGTHKPIKGDLYFAPRRNHGLAFDSERLKAALWYAKNRAPEHYIWSYLGVDLSKKKGPTREQLFGDYGYSSGKLSALGSRANMRSGLVISLSESVLTDFWTRRGDDEDAQDLRIHCPNGLPVDYITGIKPLGPDEAQFMRDLKAA